jgi:hypothetical protein
MYEFNEYINSLIGDLKINKKIKDEMAEEFRDHLEMLKLEYVSKGISENEAVKNAIESFGQENKLKSKIANSVLIYRNNTSVFTGIVLLLLVLYLGVFIPVPSIDASEVSGLLVLSMSSLSSILFFIPLGYFIPMIFLKVKKTRLVVFFTLPLGALWGIYLSSIAIGSLHISFIISIFLASLCGSILGSMLGYGILIIISRGSLLFTNSIHKIR